MRQISKGFSIVAVVLVVAVVALVGFVGWKAWGTFSDSKTADTTQTQQINSEQAPAVTDDASLDTSAATLDAVNLDDGESTELKSQTDF